MLASLSGIRINLLQDRSAKDCGHEQHCFLTSDVFSVASTLFSFGELVHPSDLSRF